MMKATAAASAAAVLLVCGSAQDGTSPDALPLAWFCRTGPMLAQCDVAWIETRLPMDRQTIRSNAC